MDRSIDQLPLLYVLPKILISHHTPQPTQPKKWQVRAAGSEAVFLADNPHHHPQPVEQLLDGRRRSVVVVVVVQCYPCVVCVCVSVCLRLSVCVCVCVCAVCCGGGGGG
jgi:hypothetical protein